MDSETTKIITELSMMFKENTKDISEIKSDLKELKKCIPTIEAHKNLEKRLEKVEGSLSKVVWMVLSAVIGAILYLVIRT
jgi:chromosome segregation ATPase